MRFKAPSRNSCFCNFTAAGTVRQSPGLRMRLSGFDGNADCAWLWQPNGTCARLIFGSRGAPDAAEAPQFLHRLATREVIFTIPPRTACPPVPTHRSSHPSR
jgi:hypothetical protein